MQKTKPSKSSFTLIEVLIVISIIGVVSSSSFFTIKNKLEQARDTKRKHDIELIQGGLEQYYDSTNCFPSSLGSCSQPLLVGNTRFIDNMPCDPITEQAYVYEYQPSLCPQWYRIYSTLENTSDRSIVSVGCQYGCGADCLYNYGVASTNSDLEFCAPPVTPTIAPTSTPVLTTPPMPSPTPTPLQYACAPGGGKSGHCELYDDPALGECPVIYPDDPTCNNECGESENRCKSSHGKHTP